MRPSARLSLKKDSLQAYLAVNLTDIRYITGVSLSSGVLLIRPAGYTLFVDSRYTELAKHDAYSEISVKDVSTLEETMKSVKACSFDAEEVTVAQLKRWKKRFKKTAFTPAENPIEYFRRMKSAAEQTLLKKALKITNEILDRIPALLKPGITELQLAWKIESMARERGAEKMSFDSIVAFGAHSSRPHHHPTSKKLKRGEIVQIDIGAVIDGYHADRSEVFFTADPSEKEETVYAAVWEAKETAKKAIKEGAAAAKVDQIARDVLKKYDLEKYFTHAVGHGVGLDIHEGITLSTRSKQKILKGEVITVEPGVYIPGKFGMRLEDMVFVKTGK